MQEAIRYWRGSDEKAQQRHYCDDFGKPLPCLAVGQAFHLIMHAAIADKHDELVALCRHYRVARLEVFGSAARGTDFDPASSDVDFLVEFRLYDDRKPLQQYFGFAEALRRTLGCPVDLVEAEAIRNPYLRAAIDKSRELVYAT